jgi:hypothetical protein
MRGPGSAAERCALTAFEITHSQGAASRTLAPAGQRSYGMLTVSNVP